MEIQNENGPTEEQCLAIVDPQSNNVPIPSEPVDIVQGRVKALTDIGLSNEEDIYYIIQSCIDPRDAWNKLSACY